MMNKMTDQLAVVLRRALSESPDVPSTFDGRGNSWYAQAALVLRRYDQLRLSLPADVGDASIIEPQQLPNHPRHPSIEVWRLYSVKNESALDRPIVVESMDMQAPKPRWYHHLGYTHFDTATAGAVALRGQYSDRRIRILIRG